jgi:hypothetical protein
MTAYRSLTALVAALTLCLSLTLADSPAAKLNVPPPGFTALFNGKNLDGWQIVVPILERQKLMADKEAYAKRVEQGNKLLKHWKVEEGVLHYDGKGNSLQTVKDYGNFELLIDWKIAEKGDSGIYLRGQPQVQIWDSERTPGARGVDKNSGSGALWNNPYPPGSEKLKGEELIKAGQSVGKIPLVKADNPVGEWNTFRIIVVGDLVTVYLNGKLVVDKKPLLNYWQRGKPVPAVGPIELQHHGDPLWFRNIFIKELPTTTPSSN